MPSESTASAYHPAVSRLLSLADFERKSRAEQPPDWHLRRVERLMQVLGDPHLAKPVVHVAGSKGKGSTSAFIASALTANGHGTGLYSSPHLHRFTERIAVDQEPISEAQFARLVNQLWHAVEAIERAGDIGTVSVFEMLTAMAFVHFRDYADVDCAVIEVGLGGRLDATNVVQPVVSVITPISLDHVPILGNTVAEIAAEKAGIIKPGVTVVAGRQHTDAAEVIRKRADDLGCAVRNAMRDVAVVIPPDRGDTAAEASTVRLESGFGEIDCTLPMLGDHQIDNARTAVAALQVMRKRGFPMSAEGIERGLADTRWHCRTELIQHPSRAPVLLDGAHNDASAAAAVAAVRSRPELRGRNLCLVLGATSGHDLTAVATELRRLRPVNVIATSSRHPKSMPADFVRSRLTDAGMDVASVQESVADAIKGAVRLTAATPDGWLIVATGSLFVAAEAREQLLGIEPEVYDDIPSGYMQPYASAR